MLNFFFAVKKEHIEFVNKIPAMTDDDLLTAYYILDDDLYFKTGNKYAQKEFNKVYRELRKRGYTDSTGAVFEHKLKVHKIA